MLKCHFGSKGSLLLGALLLLGATQARAQYLRSPQPGEVYRDYTRTMSGSRDWRVTDPNAGSPDAQANLPNSVLTVSIGDLTGAIRAEAIIDVWGGHPGTTPKQFRFNGNPYITIPELATTPSAGQCFVSEWNATVDIPLSNLVQGVNTFEGTAGGQTCFNFNWGQWGWYVMTVRVYYDPATKNEPMGTITSPANGAVLVNDPTITASPTAGGLPIGKVDFLAYYEGPDQDGDGIYTQYHEMYRRSPTSSTFLYSGHVGTATTSPYSVTWNTSLVPDQPAGSIKLVARICDTSGLCRVSNEVTGLSLVRPGKIVRLYKAAGMPQNYWVHGNTGARSNTYSIPAAHDVSLALSAVLVTPTWNGRDAGSDPLQGNTRYVKFNPDTGNEHSFPLFGANFHYQLDALTLPVNSLRTGTNTLRFFSDSVDHGIEHLWPGAGLVVTYFDPVQNCGNGTIDAGEQCDDGARVNGDGCSDACLTEYCGDGTQQAGLGEQCDDGNLTNGDGCSASCTVEPRCGDGTVNPGEQCDDGNLTNFDGCSQYCKSEPPCGNGVLNSPLEACDDGNTANGDGCTSTCAVEQYGTNIVANGAFTGTGSPWWFFSDQSATFSVVSGEARVVINTAGSNVQLSQSPIAVDGNSRYRLQFRGRNTGGDDVQVVLQKNTADFANFGLTQVFNLTSTMQQFTHVFTTTAGNKTDGRLMFWLAPYDRAGQTYFFDDVSIQKVIVVCGNNVVEGTEQCDDGNLVTGDGCSGGCRIEPRCGDGAINPGEQCDNGAANSDTAPNACRTNCLLARCGDGAVDAGEFCDGGGNTASCDSDCTTASCGDGLLNAAAGEQCDQGAANSNTEPNACRTDCELARCGDGVADAGESCDTGGASPSCDANCTPRVCGDGTVNTVAGEQCDDGNTTSGDGCRSDCRIEGCGDGVVVAPEQCDDGNIASNDGCSSTCRTESCGDGVKQPTEECDDGNTANGDGCQSDCTLLALLAYGFEETSGATAVDATGNGNNGTLAAGVARTTGGYFGRAVEFDGVAGRVEMGNFNVAANAMTIALWFRADDFGIADARLISKANGLNEGDHWWMISTIDSGSATRLRFRLKTAVGGTSTLVATQTIPTGQWVHVAATYDGAAMRLYQNGSPAGSLTKFGAIAADATVPAWIGDNPGGGKSFDGRIDEVLIDNRAYSQSDVAALMTQPLGLCGNGTVDSGEQCDNGPFNSDTTPNACRRDCRLPRCGDRVTDLGESCDAGGPTPTCDANCTPAVCGDGTLNTTAGEVCDTGGASATCDADCSTPACGDGSLNTASGEQCDNGASNSNTLPNACRTNCRTAACGDAVVDNGETCDTGGDSPSCDANCTPAACGDGTLNPAANEQCDTGGASATCDANCTTATCGDGTLNTLAGEQCDNGASNSNTAPNACRTNCRTAGCGDGVTDAGEQCDDANASNTDACLTTCRTASCGDGHVRAGVEQCDDGNLVSGDGCGPACTPEFCGDGTVQPVLGEVCDDGAANSDTTPYACREDCQPAACGDGTVDQRPTPPSEFIDDGGVEQWSGGALVQWSTFLNGGEVRQNSTVQRSGASCAEVTRQRAGSLGIYQVVFGLEPGFEFHLSGWTRVNPGATTNGFPSVRVRNVTRNQYLQMNGTWSATVADALVGGVAGNGAWTQFSLVFRTPATHAITDSYQVMLIHQASSPLNSKVFHDDIRLTGPLAEQCDDGNLINRDRCSATCEIESEWCGDNVVNGPEQCDDANQVDTDACLSSCLTARCGDGVVRAGVEQCDDGNANNSDNCSNTCVVNFCGDGITQPGRGEECDDANQVNDDVCSNACLLTGGFCGDGIRQTGLGEACDDGNQVNNDNCSNSCVVNFCGDGIEQTARGEQCDDGNQATGDGCRPNCTDERCGDGIKDPQEGCDDGDLQSNDGCSATCVVEFCGDGIIHSGLDEECDDGNQVNDDLCNNACESTNAFCGNGFTEAGIGEECDDANSVPDDTCDNACQLTGFFCGDGVVQPGLGEVCDDGNQVPDDLCNNLCRPTNAYCGNGNVEHGIGEQCDDGNAAIGDGCRPDCTAEGCGDSIVDPGEECDDGDVESWDGCQSDCVSDLFLRVDKTHQGTGVPPAITLDWVGEHPMFEVYRSINDRTAVDDPFNLMDATGDYEWPDPGTPGTRGFIAYYSVVSRCGNGALDPGEACDDGNNMSLDGCRSNCADETCGDGVIDAGELCDDGNVLAGDGCRADCTIESCGDHRVDPGEECDDGNLVSGDGCSAGCLSEDCGNGRLESGEECDDGNTNNLDGCLNSCDNAACGDGFQRTGIEQCDDGDLAGGDGCSATCTREFGWTCVGSAPTACTQNCVDQDGDTFDNCNPGIEGDDGKPADCDPAVATCTTDCTTNVDGDAIKDCADTCIDHDGDGAGTGSGCPADNCPGNFNPDQLNSDGGTFGDVCDVCPADASNSCDQAQSKGQNVGPAGGTLTTADGRVSVSIPAGALTTDRSISVTQGAPGFVPGQNGVAMVDRLLPAGQAFLAPVTATFKWLDATSDGTVDGSSPAISEGHLFIFQDGVQIGGPCSDPAFQPGTCTSACCDVSANTWTVAVSHFSTFLLSAAGCGNGVVDPGEQCDDGNDVQADGCHDNCTLPACGDGIVDLGEDCDDGNPTTGDGCSATCSKLTSDDFSACTLDARWTFVDPLGDSDYFLSGAGTSDAHVSIVVPAGASHDAAGSNDAPRLMQDVDNSNFQILVKIDSAVAQATEFQGVIVEQDPNDYIRFDVYSNGTRWFVFAGSIENGALASVPINVQGPAGASPIPLWLRVTRSSNTWQLEHSTNGTTFTSHGTFLRSMTVTRAGVFAGNFGSAGSAPQHTAVFDYFFDALNPINPEDAPNLGTGRALTLEPGANGTITANPSRALYYCDEAVTLTAVPDPGYRFDEWGGDLSGSVNPETLVMSADRTVSASFVAAVGPPAISNVQVEAFHNRATITWDTNEPASSRVDYGLSSSYTHFVESAALVTHHSLTFFGLQPETTYHFQLTSTDIDTETATTPDDEFMTTAFEQGPVQSDDFDSCTLDPAWVFVDPSGDSSYELAGAGTPDAHLRIRVPGGSSHDAFGTNAAPRVLQTVAGDPDFQVELKLDSSVSQGFQFQGLLFQQDLQNWMRIDVVSTGTQHRIFAAKTIGGTSSVTIDRLLATGASPVPLWIRVTRTGDDWTVETSTNGTTWTIALTTTNAASFTHVMTVNALGPMAGNAVGNPALVAKFDYLFETLAPIVPEDGAPAPGPGFVLDVQTAGSGSVTIDPDQDVYHCDESVTLTAVPAGGFAFTGWSGDRSGLLNPETIEMTEDRDVTASFAVDNQPPLIDHIVVVPGDTFADVSWITNKPATSRVDWGVFAADEDFVSSSSLVTQHSLRLTDLTPSTTYQFEVTSVDSSARSRTSPTDDFTTLAAPPGAFASNDFNTCALDGSWTFVNPLGDAAYTLTGQGTPNARLNISVPAGVTHDAYNINNAPRVMQAALDVDFVVEVKLDSTLNANGKFEGVLVDGSGGKWIRADFVAGGGQVAVFAAHTTAGTSTAVFSQALGALPATTPRWLRLTRTGDNWSVAHSFDGNVWTTDGNFVFALDVIRVGVFAGNASPNPAHTASFDYMFEAADPVVPEDAGAPPGGNSLTLQVNGGGSIQKSPDQAFYCGGSVQLTAVPDAFWTFTGWGGDLSGTTNPQSLSMAANRTVSATFAPPAGCGNGTLNGGEQCDDGNNDNGDGCSGACRVEGCGNGVLEAGEQCDDGNVVGGDGCRANCTTEACGDGILDPGEECDEGPGQGLPSADWYGGGRRYRAPLEVSGNGFARTTRTAEMAINLQALLAAAGGTGTVNTSSLLVVEVTSTGTLVAPSVAFQLDGTTSAGTLVWLLNGATGASATRYFHLYFDTIAFSAPVFSDSVVVTDGIVDAGLASYRVVTPNGSYFYQKEAGALSSLLDANGNDWINHNNTAGSQTAGEFRGIPQMFSSTYHPGMTTASSSLVSDGPLKARIDSPSDNGQHLVRWEFYADYARMTVVQATGSYWILYEGTPGGLLNRTGANADFSVRSNGTQTPADTSWSGDIAGDEWVYFADPTLGRSLFLAHHTNDSVVDSYFPLDLPAGGPDSDWMTVFGFGRNGSTPLLTGPRQVTIGLLGTTAHAAATTGINSNYKDLVTSVGTPVDGEAALADQCRSDCDLPACGDGIQDSGEDCDDGNTVDGDGCQANCGLPAAGYVLAYGFEETAGSFVEDTSGHGKHGTLAGGGTRSSSGYFGRAVEFNGSAGNVSVGTLDLPGSATTISMWINADDFDINDARLISKATGTLDADHWWMLSTVQSSPGVIRLRGRIKTGAGAGTTSTLVATGGNLATATWTHAMMTYDGATLRLFKDCVEVGNAPVSGAISQNAAAAVRIGDQPVSGTKTFDGRIDEVRIHDFAMTAAQCLQQILIPASCGNGTVNAPLEECDDNNNDPGDGCDATCQREPFCGDGFLDAGEQCDDGNNAAGDCCAANCSYESAGSSCEDGQFCTTGDTCNGSGTCGAGGPRDCSDADICTDDTCNETTNACVNTRDNGNDPSCAVCGDGVPEGLEQCDDSNTANGDCCSSTCQYESAGSGCEDGDFCSDGDTCDGAGTCDAGGPRDCADADVCTDDSCNETTNACDHVPDPSNDLSCTVCGNGTIEGLEQCDDGNTANGDCCSSTCQYESAGSGCEDGDFCSDGDTCDGAGTCDAGAPRDCADADICTDDSCNETTDACDHAYDVSNDPSCVTCGDGDVDAISGEQCDDGNTVGGDCCSATCQFENAGSTCSDGLFCTANDTCNGSGACTAGAPRSCDDSQLCTDDACNETTDQCDNTYDQTNHASCVTCGDGDLDAGEQCDDGNTADGDCCSATCQFENAGSTCSDGLFCTATDTCNGSGGCVGGAPPSCDDSVVCTDDVCDEANDECDHTFDVTNHPSCTCGDGNLDGSEQCDDGNTNSGDGCSATCTIEAVCGNGSVEPGEQCDDSNTANGDCCTSSCQFEAASSPCSDGLFCTETDLCNGAGVCVAGAARSCTDGLVCTDDSCNETTDQCDNPFDVTNAPSCACGNGTIDSGEDCDDGNTANGDGCTSTCQGIVSDEFSVAGPSARWTAVHPAGGTVTQTGDGDIVLNVPGGSFHDAFPGSASPVSGTNDSVRAMQDADNSDFRLHVRLDSSVNTSSQSQGILVEQDADDWIRFDVSRSGTNWYFVAIIVQNNAATIRTFASQGAGSSPVGQHLRVTRTGNVWRFERSLDGVTWTTINTTSPAGQPTFTHALTVTKVGVFAGNSGATAATTPALTARFEFFYETRLCGNGVTNGIEECDDGNAINTDACLSSCANAECGDGFLHTGVEECDSGAANSDTTPDACRTTCQSPACGDTIVDSGETCDDGNTTPGDGCSATCQTE